MPIQRIQPKGLAPTTVYSHVVRAGNTVYIAGQTAQDSNGKIIGVGDMAAQTRQVFENIKTALASVGGNLSNLVRITTYITDASKLEGYRSVRAQYLAADKPASTLVVVSRLASPDYLVEVEAVAVLD